MKTLRSTAAVSMILIAVFGLLLGGCAAGTPGSGGGSAAAPETIAEGSYKYVCACGPECLCATNCDKPGNCACGKPLMQKKILRVFPDSFGVCPDPNCALNTPSRLLPNTQCECGKPYQKFPKRGAYGCACQGCDCNCTANNPGNCACGKEMKKL